MTSSIVKEDLDRVPLYGSPEAVSDHVRQEYKLDVPPSYVREAWKTHKLAYRIFLGRRHSSKADIRAWLTGAAE